MWDTIHTAIRPTIAAALGVLPNGEATGLEDALAAVGSSTTALASHAVKAGLRMAVNISPDPVSTATASLTEDILVAGVVVLIVTHPWAALAVSMTLLAIGLTIIVLLWRQVQAGEYGFACQARDRFRLPGERSVSPARREIGFACQASVLVPRRSPSATLPAARLRRRYPPLAFGDVTRARSAGSSARTT